MNKKELLEKPLWQMSGAEFVFLQENFLAEKQQQQIIPQQAPKNYCHGMEEFAAFLGCSQPTAYRIKSSGVINDAITQWGRTIIIDGEMALDLIKKSERNFKGLGIH
ncbi:MAG: DUF3853 family protein [Bacteroidales bacterium]|jgi:hypothetical protein|nr:DUF3853 family protein [Bacteroidales bacterium]